MGHDEMNKAGRYTEREKLYVENLLACREAMNWTEKSFFQLQQHLTANYNENFSALIILMRNKINVIISTENSNTNTRAFLKDSELRNHITSLYSASLALSEDLKASDLDRNILINEDLNFIATKLFMISRELQERLNVELDHVENWKDQSLFFFDRLEINLVYYFIIATLFIFISFMISDWYLKQCFDRLRKGVQEISRGNLQYRFKDSTNDIIGKVMSNFDNMAESLQDKTLELQNINDELNKKADELQEANEHKDQFLANMSHELRTPLNSIIGFSDLMIANAHKYSPEKIQKYSDKVLSAAEHLLELISDLLEVAKINAGVLTLEPQEFDLNSLCKNVIEMLQPIAMKKDLELLIEIREQEPVLIMADRRLIKQALINLLNNALKFTKDGYVKLTVETENEEVLIHIEDTGIGISPKDHNKIFKNFHRVEQGFTSNYEGVGLGLTLTQRIVELHQGSIKLKSILNKGSIFTILLVKKEIKEG
jgi:signal transduction histidine kinase